MFFRMFFRRVLFGTAFVCAPFVLSGCHRCSSPEKRAEWITNKIASKLELTDAQRPKLDAIKAELLATRAEMHAGRTQTLDDVATLLKAKTFDKGKAKEIAASRKAALEKHVDAILDRIAALHATLDDKQKERAVKLIEELRKRCD